MCHRKIRDGRKFCDNCKQKRKTKADESYLDSLLSSVGVNQTGNKNSSQDFIEPEQYEDDFYAQNENENPDFSGYDQNTDGQGIDQGTYYDQGLDTGADYNQVEDTGVYSDQGSGINESGFDDGQAGYAEQENPVQGDGEMDEMLSDLLGEMDEAGVGEEQPESEIREEDLESIFDEAEAYAELLNDNNAGQSAENNASSDIVDVIDENGYQDTAGQQEAAPGQTDSSFIDLEWNNNDPSAQGGSDEYGDGNVGDEQDEILLNEGIQGENSEYNSAEEAFSDFDPLSESVAKEDKPKKKRLSWFKRLFGNVNDEVTPEMIEADKAKKAEAEEQEKLRKAEKKKKDEAKKAAAQAEKERKKAEADAERNRKLALAIEKKNAAKERQRKKKEQALAIAEYEVEHGKINKAGATILFVIFAVLTIVIIIGTNIFSYNLSIENAREDFSKKKYNEAYYDVYGYDLKIRDSGIEEDILLYDKIMTVMYVKSQLNSYEYYMTSNNKAKALNSLLKGLQKYDKYLMLAKELDITTDLDYVRQEILEKLDSEFNLSEQEADKLVMNLDPVDYSEYLYGLIGDYEEELKKYK